MKVIDAIKFVHARGAMVINLAISAADIHTITPTLIGGWDKRGDDGCFPVGVGRFSHPAILADIDFTGSCVEPVLAYEMNLHDLTKGLWVQSNLLPVSPEERDEKALEMKKRGNTEAPVETDLFAPPTWKPKTDRAVFFRKVWGFTPRDLAEFLEDLRVHDPKHYKLLLSKNVIGLLDKQPDLIKLPWPEVTKRRWMITGERDHLPPIRAMYLFMEVARLGQNMRSHICLSFDEKGQEIFLRPLLDAISNAAGSGSMPKGVERLLEMAPFQSFALVPPQELLQTLNPVHCARWSIGMASVSTITLARARPQTLTTFSQPQGPELGKFIANGINAHPRYWPEYRGAQRWSLSKGNAATYYGHGYHLHGTMGCLLLADQARKWSKEYRTGNDVLRYSNVNGSFDAAVAALLYGWVEATSPAALVTALAPVIGGQEQHLGRPLTKREQTLDVLSQGNNFGQDLCKRARKELKRLPKPGEPGYTAWYHAHLWANQDGDDIDYYKKLQTRWVKRHKRLLGKGDDQIHRGLSEAPQPPGWLDNPRQNFDPRAIRRHLRRRLKMSSSIIAARGAQNCAMMMMPPATDPMFVVNAKPNRWKDPGVKCARPVQKSGRGRYSRYSRVRQMRFFRERRHARLLRRQSRRRSQM